MEKNGIQGIREVADEGIMKPIQIEELIRIMTIAGEGTGEN